MLFSTAADNLSATHLESALDLPSESATAACKMEQAFLAFPLKQTSWKLAHDPYQVAVSQLPSRNDQFCDLSVLREYLILPASDISQPGFE